MKSKKSISIFIFTLTLLAAGCGDLPFSPPGETNLPPGNKTTFGLVEVTITGIGTENMAASATPAEPATAFSFTDPQNADNSGDGTIQMEPVTNGSFTYGARGSDGYRYIFATFKVRNAEIGGDNYDTPRENLTFMAVDDAATLGHTAVVELRLFDGTLITDPQATNMAKTILPTGNVGYSGGAFIQIKTDVLQILSEGEAASITVPAGVDVFPYGFITSSPGVTPGSRQMLPFAAGDQFDGLVTFAFKIPLEMQANQDPFEITMLFLPVDDSTVRLTQSLEEQTPMAAAAIAERMTELSANYISLLPGNRYTIPATSRRLCGPVRVAGTQVKPMAVLFPAPPELQIQHPDPYAMDGSASNIPTNTAFSASYNNALKPANSTNFVIHGGQSGRLFTLEAYTTTGSTVTAPAGTFFPGELLEVTLTSGLGSCFPDVARFRAEVTTGSGSFSETTESVGTSPRNITAGDWDGDGDLDLAVVNEGDLTVSLLANNGSGSFSQTTVPVGSYDGEIVAGDWDGDGDLDLAVENNSSSIVRFLKNDGAGAFSESTVLFGNSVTDIITGDLNGDGDLDLVMINAVDEKVILLANNGAGIFSETTITDGNDPFKIVSGDWDSDGDLDLAVTNAGVQTISLLTNDGNGHFIRSSFMVGDEILGIVAGDWNGDGDVDLAASTNNSSVSVWANNGPGVFSETSETVLAAQYSMSGPIITGDWDGDGDLDLAVTTIDLNNLNESVVWPLFNNGSGDFSASTVLVGEVARGIAAGDWDGDGDLDLAVSNSNDDNISLLENN